MNKVFIYILVCFLVSFFCSAQHSSKLSIGIKDTKKIEFKSKHTYTINLKKGQFAMLNVRQQGIDLKVLTYNPEGDKIEEFDSNNGSNGDELVIIDSHREGSYRLEVMPLGETKKKRKGTYEIEFISLVDEVETHLNSVLKSLNNRGFLPGFAVNVLDADSLRYEKALGYSKIEDKTPYSIGTVQNIASISKTFIAISLMMMVEEGKLTLDTPINDILPFEVTNPYFPTDPITIRHLATHTSTINDFPYYYEKAGVLLEKPPLALSAYPKEIQKTIKMARKNEDMTMVEFIKKMLTKKGEWYKKKNFFKRLPGQEWYYSNVGAVLAAHIVELVSGVSYDTFVKTRILEPLNLQSAGWNETEVDNSKLASNYTQGSLLLPALKIITYPDGQIYMNSKDLGKYLMSLIKGFNGQDGLITADSFQEMMKVQHEQKDGDFKGRKVGIFWWHSKSLGMGHNGGDTGVITMMRFDPETQRGFTFMCNMDPTETGDALAEFEKIWMTVKRYAHLL